MKNVTVIPASINKFTDMPLVSKSKRKVAAYARVSTGHEEQQTSYEAQIGYYTEFIKSHSDWEFVGIYVDEGVTGTSMAKREGFLRMIEDALSGKISLIVTKSVRLVLIEWIIFGLIVCRKHLDTLISFLAFAGNISTYVFRPWCLRETSRHNTRNHRPFIFKASLHFIRNKKDHRFFIEWSLCI